MRFPYSLSLAVVLLLPSASLLSAQVRPGNDVSNNQTNQVTADKDKQGKPLPSPRHDLTFVHTHNRQQTRIAITYGAPSVNGRKIYGDLVPYGHWWRAGANEATSFTTDHPVRIGSLRVPAGAYTLDVLPAESGWQLIINKQTGQWGTKYDPSQDLGHVPMTGKPLSPPQETLSYSFDQSRDSSATLHLRWANEDESVQITYE